MFYKRQPASNITADVVKLVWGRRTASSGTRSSFRSLQVPWTCPNCRIGAGKRNGGVAQLDSMSIWRRQLSNSARSLDERPSDAREVRDSLLSTSRTHSETSPPTSPPSSLPSQSANRRSDLSKRASRILDQLLARASVASQHINAYTGTDYSGIEALRRDIAEQEQKARGLHTAVSEAKSKHNDAHAKQTSAQREIVGLLERKSSWSPADLERYMSLVRSEHLNDQDVQVAKDNLTTAERSLEDARSLLERLERKQYHEEQIWSDTIRRNSTWLTFGLMGVNILLLLAQIAIFEPYRRKKIVRDVKSALDEKTLTAVSYTAETAKHIDTAMSLEHVLAKRADEVDQPLDAIVPVHEDDVGVALPPVGRVSPRDANTATEATLSNETNPAQLPAMPPSPAAPMLSKGTLGAYRATFRDLFSERPVQMRRVDVTNTALQGAATGVAVMGLLFVLLRPK